MSGVNEAEIKQVLHILKNALSTTVHHSGQTAVISIGQQYIQYIEVVIRFLDARAAAPAE
ncbi:MAG: hypothetical protein ABSA58_25165 [Acetobacteraceae bacterium]|jgi:hypothetical protein